MTLTFNQWLPGVATYTLTKAPTRLARVNANLTGGGRLTGAITHFGAHFTGTGTLSVLVTSVHPQLGGEGKLAAVAWITQAPVTAYLDSAGQLSATVAPTGP